MTEFTAKSGAKIMIAPAPWKDAKELKKAIESILVSKSTLNIDFKDMTSMAALMLAIDGSDAVEVSLWPCLLKCTRNLKKIEMNTFDDVEARKDYYEIVTACVKENLGPLVESISSQFAAPAAKPGAQPAENGSPE